MYRFFIMMIAFFSSSIVFAQKDYKTGNSNIDASLQTINSGAETNLSSFKADLSSKYKKTHKDLDLLFDLKMDAAEVYLALEIVEITNSPIEVMVDVYENDHHKGWGFMIKEMGIKPGSEDFHDLKETMHKKARKS